MKILCSNLSFNDARNIIHEAIQACMNKQSVKFDVKYSEIAKIDMISIAYRENKLEIQFDPAPIESEEEFDSAFPVTYFKYDTTAETNDFYLSLISTSTVIPDSMRIREGVISIRTDNLY